MRKLRWLAVAALLVTSAACDGRGYPASSYAYRSPDAGYNYPSRYYSTSSYYNNVNATR
jgi:hypothetical protein